MGCIIPTGVANPVLIMLGVAILMTVLATRRRLGRYVFAIGGNPEAAELSGINTRRIIMWTFVIMGVLAAVSAIISTARLQSATSGSGTGLELQVIAAAVIGGTSFAGGIGTIPGAILGRAHHPVARLGHAAAALRQLGRRHRRRRRAGRGGRHRHHRSEARHMSEMSQAPTTSAGPAEAPATRHGVPLVEMRDIRVAFGGVHAVENVTVDLHAGEVVGLVGGNGAGKSTLMKALSGRAPAGQRRDLRQRRGRQITNPRDAKDYGIETIYQTLALADNVDAAANIFLGREIVSRASGRLTMRPWRPPRARS